MKRGDAVRRRPPRPAAVVVVVDAANRVLLLRGRHGWASPGGTCERGETPRDGAARELHEETGIVVHPSSLAFLRTQRSRSGRPVYVFMCRVARGTSVRLSAEHRRHRWAREKDLRSYTLRRGEPTAPVRRRA